MYTPVLLIKVGFKGSKLYRHVFVMCSNFTVRLQQLYRWAAATNITRKLIFYKALQCLIIRVSFTNEYDQYMFLVGGENDIFPRASCQHSFL